MATNSGPHMLHSTRAIMAPNGKTIAKSVTSEFYQELETDFDNFSGHVLVAEHESSEAWDIWEMHPAGDELVYLIFGDCEFVLFVDGAEEIVRLDESGAYVIVPKAVWHTARPRQKSKLLFITPGEDTQHAEFPPQ